MIITDIIVTMDKAGEILMPAGSEVDRHHIMRMEKLAKQPHYFIPTYPAALFHRTKHM